MAGIYIHVPFCKTRCIYCDFYTRTDISPKDDYIEAVCKELLLRRDYLSEDIVSTIYFGGGTPSQLSYADLKRIFDVIYSTYPISENVEITMEANPDDLSIEYLESLQKLPFNRLSIGIQSFDDGELKFLKRRHTSQKAIDAVTMCQSLGYNNISIDLMYGLPNQTMDIWQRNLNQAISLNVSHISSYHLIYEQGTRLYRLFKIGQVRPIDEDLSVDMFSLMIDKLHEAGFEHYEISNFAKNGSYSQHNSSYWLGKRYLGVGPAAHSFDGNDRAWNIASTPKYIQSINKGSLALEIEYLDLNARYNDFILTGMRTKWGVDLIELEKLYGNRMKDYCLRNVERYVKEGFVKLDNQALTLTKNGIFISDGIMSDLMWVD